MKGRDTWELVVMVALAITGFGVGVTAIFWPNALLTPPGKKITRHDMMLFLLGRTGTRIAYIIMGFGLSALATYLLAS